MKKIEYSQSKRVFKNQFPKTYQYQTVFNEKFSSNPYSISRNPVQNNQQYHSAENLKIFRYTENKRTLPQSKQYFQEQKIFNNRTPSNYSKNKFDFDKFDNNCQSLERYQQRQKTKGIQIISKPQDNIHIITKNKENNIRNKSNHSSNQLNYNNLLSQMKLQNNNNFKSVEPISPPTNYLVKKDIVNNCDNSENSDTIEYRHLHQKLNNLQSKILKMKNNLQQKREDKKAFLQAQQKERIKIQNERKSIKKQKLQKQKSTSHYSQIKKQILQKKQQSGLKQLVTQFPQHKQFKYFQFNPYSPKHNIYYVSEIVRAYKQQKSLARQHLIYSMHFFKTMQNAKRANQFEIAAKNVNLSRKQCYKDKKTVVFDLDETLIHCNQNLQIPYDVKLAIKFHTGEILEAGINIRPYAMDILKNLSKNFQVIVFTASHSCYANVVLNYLDPQNKYIQHRLFRQHCYFTQEGMYVKDLRIINRNLADMVLIDNAAYSYSFQVDNGIPIIPYYQGKNDYELKALQKYIQNLFFAKDVREVNKKTFKLDLYKNYADPERLVSQLYLNQSK